MQTIIDLKHTDISNSHAGARHPAWRTYRASAHPAEVFHMLTLEPLTPCTRLLSCLCNHQRQISLKPSVRLDRKSKHRLCQELKIILPHSYDGLLRGAGRVMQATRANPEPTTNSAMAQGWINMWDVQRALAW